MGTNYYLLTKNLLKNKRNSSQLKLLDVQELVNGYVYNNKYYRTMDEAREDFCSELHIGKSSFGWHFLLCSYPNLNINNLNDWKLLFKNKDNIIVNEAQEVISPEEMLEIITDRGDKNYVMSDEEEKKQLEAYNNFIGSSIKFKAYEELLRYNSAVRGLNGLWAHNSIDTKRTEGTYDIINGEEHIFS